MASEVTFSDNGRSERATTAVRHSAKAKLEISGPVTAPTQPYVGYQFGNRND